MRTILVPVDGSPTSDGAAEEAVRSPASFGAEVTDQRQPRILQNQGVPRSLQVDSLLQSSRRRPGGKVKDKGVACRPSPRAPSRRPWSRGWGRAAPSSWYHGHGRGARAGIGEQVLALSGPSRCCAAPADFRPASVTTHLTPAPAFLARAAKPGRVREGLAELEVVSEKPGRCHSELPA
jgi:hypothetical protein